MWVKPRMRPTGKGWSCRGGGWIAFGATRRQAYESWAEFAGIPLWLAGREP